LNDRDHGPSVSDGDAPTGLEAAFDFPDEDQDAAPVTGWLSAVGQMMAALLVVVGLVALFMGLAVILRWLLP
jgi:hypothetical protein